MADTKTPTPPSATAIALHLGAHAPQLHPDVVREYAGVAHGVEATLADIAKIEASPELTAVGRTARAESRRAEASKVLLDPLRDKIARTEQRLADVERDAVPQPPRSQDPATVQREIAHDREVRDRLHGRQSLEILPLVLDAVARGDVDFVRAVGGGPQAFPLLGPKEQAVVRQMQLEHSESAEDVARLRDELKIHRSLLEAAEHDLKVTKATVDPTTTLAKDGKDRT